MSVAVGLDPAAVLEELLGFPSPTGAVDEAAEALARIARDAGYDARRDDAGNVVMTWGSGAAGDAIVLLGHLDTVPGDVPVRLSAGRLHGRGSVDAKGPLAAALVAVSRLQRDQGRPLTVIAACDEEGASLGARHLCCRVAPAAVIVLEPSGWDTVTTGYRGCVRLSAVVTRVAAHHALPQPGAADCLVDRLAALRGAFAAMPGRSVDRVQVRVNALTTAEGAEGDSAAAAVELRIPAGHAVDDVVRRAAAVLDDAIVTIDNACEAVTVARTNPAVRALARAIAGCGGRPRYTTKTGTSDLNVVLPAWRCPAAVYGPGDSALDHTAHESIDVAELRVGANVLEAALRQLR